MSALSYEHCTGICSLSRCACSAKLLARAVSGFDWDTSRHSIYLETCFRSSAQSNSPPRDSCLEERLMISVRQATFPILFLKRSISRDRYCKATAASSTMVAPATKTPQAENFKYVQSSTVVQYILNVSWSDNSLCAGRVQRRKMSGHPISKQRRLLPILYEPVSALEAWIRW